MAGTIIVDRIESDASYASTINVAAQVTFSNTVSFSSTANVTGNMNVTGNVSAGALTATGNVSAGALNTTGNVRMSTVGTRILNSSGNPILQQTGSVLQVINSVKADTQSVTSASYVDITSLTVTITPTSSSSKILIRANVNNLSDTAAYGVFINLLRNSTPLTYNTSGGNANNYTAWASGGGGDTRINASGSIDYLDSPATTSAITYKMQMLTPIGTAYINSWAVNRDVASVSSITVMEIAG